MAVKDVILAAVLLFMTAMIFFVVNFSTKVMIANIIVLPAVNNSNTQAAYQAFQDMAKPVDRLDYVFFCCFIGLFLGIVISGYFVGGNPIFMFIYFLVFVIGNVFSMVLTNTWNTVSTQSTWATILPGYSAQTVFPITNHIMSFLPLYVTVLGLTGMLIMFSRPSVEQL